MIKYHNHTVYFIAYAKMPANTSAGKMMEYVGFGLFIDYRTGEIINISCTLLTEEAKEFLAQLIIGFNLHDQKIEELLGIIQFHYHGLGQKPICVALKSAYEKYVCWKHEKSI